MITEGRLVITEYADIPANGVADVQMACQTELDYPEIFENWNLDWIHCRIAGPTWFRLMCWLRICTPEMYTVTYYYTYKERTSA